MIQCMLWMRHVGKECKNVNGHNKKKLLWCKTGNECDKIGE